MSRAAHPSTGVRTGDGSRRPDVAFFVPSLAGGGAERVLLDLATATAGRGFAVDLVAASAHGPYRSEVPDDVRLVDLGRRRVVAASLPLLAYLRRNRPRALLSTLDHANVVAVLAARTAGGIRVAVRQANAVADGTTRLSPRIRVLHVLARRTYARADAVVAVSEGVADQLVSRLDLARERIDVIPNPSITPRLLRGAEDPPDHPWFADRDRPVLVAVGRMNRLKRFDVLLRAFARVRDRRPSRLVILGDGELRGDLERLAQELGVADDVDMPGFVGNPFPYMASADLYVLSSESEGMPNALIQALALGTRVVATDCPSGPREVLDHGRYGELVPVDDDAAMADAIEASLDAPAPPVPDTWLAQYRLDPVVDRYLRLLDLDRPSSTVAGG